METSNLKKFHKLVRDNIPQIIEKSGGQPKWVNLCKEHRRGALLDKLREEVEELSFSKEKDKFLDEAADVYEVLLALVYERGFLDADLELTAKKKRREKGAFDKFVWLESVENS